MKDFFPDEEIHLIGRQIDTIRDDRLRTGLIQIEVEDLRADNLNARGVETDVLRDPATAAPGPDDHVPFDGPMAARAGALRPLTRAQELSLGDRACLATALELAVTADRTWGALELAVPIELVR